MHRLYVFLRSDLASMTPGKAAAQVAHAASQLAYAVAREIADAPTSSTAEYFKKIYDEWQLSPSHEAKSTEDRYRGFGTTIVLDGGGLLDCKPFGLSDAGVYALKGIVSDPSYPIKDGGLTHYVDLATCYWIFDDPELDPRLAAALKELELYGGNHY